MSDGLHDTEVAEMPQGDDESVRSEMPARHGERRGKKIGQLLLRYEKWMEGFSVTFLWRMDLP